MKCESNQSGEQAPGSHVYEGGAWQQLLCAPTGCLKEPSGQCQLLDRCSWLASRAASSPLPCRHAMLCCHAGLWGIPQQAQRVIFTGRDWLYDEGMLNVRSVVLVQFWL
jgi:hypothetical protein